MALRIKAQREGELRLASRRGTRLRARAGCWSNGPDLDAGDWCGLVRELVRANSTADSSASCAWDVELGGLIDIFAVPRPRHPRHG